MPREMPILEHKGDKLLAGKSFWSIPQDITIYAFKHLTYSETQLLIYLIGNKPGWQLSNVNDCVGCNDRTVRAARAELASLGFITLSAKKIDGTFDIIEVDFDWIREVVENDWDKATVKKILFNRSGSPQP